MKFKFRLQIHVHVSIYYNGVKVKCSFLTKSSSKVPKGRPFIRSSVRQDHGQQHGTNLASMCKNGQLTNLYVQMYGRPGLAE